MPEYGWCYEIFDDVSGRDYRFVRVARFFVGHAFAPARNSINSYSKDEEVLMAHTPEARLKRMLQFEFEFANVDRVNLHSS